MPVVTLRRLAPPRLATATLVALALAFAAPTVVTAEPPPETGPDAGPIVIGHRGASGYRPEHTLASYALAIELGAEFIEPDIVSTKDGVLVARHENEISGTTDVASHSEFAERRTTKTIDGVAVTGWFTEDFTLAELKTLRAKERLPQVRPDNTTYDGQFEIPTLQEVIGLAKREGQRRGGRIGIYPETKHPSYFDSIDLSLEEPLVETLHANGYRSPNSPVYIQSFEVGNLEDLAGITRLPLVQLLNNTGAPFDFVESGDPRTYADLATPSGLEFVARHADGVGANKDLVIPRDAAGNLLEPSSFVEDAHDAGLVVHAWTFRAENTFLPTNLRLGDPTDPTFPRQWGDSEAEYEAFYETGLDGVFADQPDLAVAARASR
jgi:glycerophosphoryl diester phosphodiesterase